MQEVKLGILVVYLLDPADRKMLEIHLEMIKKNISFDYTIYAAANRFHAELKPILEGNSKVMICDLPTTQLIQGAETSFYLDRLAKIAVQDGATHLLTLHVDSFPINSSKFEELIFSLSSEKPCAASMLNELGDNKPHGSFLLLRSDFYEKYKPEFFISKEVENSDEYINYKNLFPHTIETGAGIGFSLFKNDLDWIKLERTNANSMHYTMAGVYGDVAFHLGGINQKVKVFYNDFSAFYKNSNGGQSVFHKVSNLTRTSRLQGIKNFIAGKIILKKSHKENLRISNLIKTRLYANPTGFTAYLTGRRSELL